MELVPNPDGNLPMYEPVGHYIHQRDWVAQVIAIGPLVETAEYEAAILGFKVVGMRNVPSKSGNPMPNVCTAVYLVKVAEY